MTPIARATAVERHLVTTLTRPQKRAILLALDLAAALVAGLATLALFPVDGMVAMALVVAAISPAGSAALGLHRVKLNAYEAEGLFRTAALALFAALAARATARVAGHAVPEPAFVLFALMFLCAAVALRLAARATLEAVLRRTGGSRPVVIYGAGTAGVQLAAALRRSATSRAAAFLDDNPALHGLTLAGLRVHPPADLPTLMQRHEVDRIILAMPGLSAERQDAIARRLAPLGPEVLALPSLDELLAQPRRRLLPLSPDRFLNRRPVDPTDRQTQTRFAGRTVLVTGAGGSIGAELCRQLLACRPARLILLEQSEAALYTLDKDLRPISGTTQVLPRLASVCDRAALDAILGEWPVDAIFHAAALKHVPLVEANPCAAVETNVFGTRCLAEAARAAGVGRVVLISTDKAVRPAGVMGATKRLAELIVQDAGLRPGVTRFAIVRFGNVLGSSGSVVPLFREQIARGGPVTLTHPDVTRYFMTVAEAVRLVLSAGASAPLPQRGADVFVLDMGKPVRIRDLALQMIAAAGLTARDADHPQGEIDLVVTGLRPGEKLHEELLVSPTLLPTPHPRILRAEEPALPAAELQRSLSALRSALTERDDSALRRALRRATDPDRCVAPPAAPVPRPAAEWSTGGLRH